MKLPFFNFLRQHIFIAMRMFTCHACLFNEDLKKQNKTKQNKPKQNKKTNKQTKNKQTKTKNRLFLFPDSIEIIYHCFNNDKSLEWKKNLNEVFKKKSMKSIKTDI